MASRSVENTHDPRQRAHEKQASRDEDARALATGEKTRDQLRRENGIFSGLDVRPDLDGAESLS